MSKRRASTDEAPDESANADTMPPEPEPLPEEFPAEGPTLEEHAAGLGTHPASLAAMKAYFRFGEGRKLSREHYELALAHVENLKFQ